VLILGAGFGGLELATRLSEEVAEQVHVTLVDQSEWFSFGFSKLDVMFGRAAPEDVRLYYRDIAKPSVSFRNERVLSIDPRTRVVVTDGGTYEPDVLVVALGADLDPAATPGLEEGGYEFYTPAGAERVREVLAGFPGGDIVISVLGGFFKCPPAPNETALMLDGYLRARGLRDASTIHLLSPLPMPIPISRETSGEIVAALEERGIEYWPESIVTHLDAGQRVAHLADGRTVAYDLFLAVPIHRAPPVVEKSGLTVDGWVPVDPITFQTQFSDVYAVGDVTSAPVPRAGVIAEGEAGTVADVLISRLRSDGLEPEPYAGSAVCYIEFGDDTVARVDVNFLSGPQPTAVFHGPSLDLSEEKRQFGATRRRRWFGIESEAAPVSRER
jgi:sulfide:quinone oxidoreductase